MNTTSTASTTNQNPQTQSGKSGFHFSSIDRVLDWAKASSLWFVASGSGCCADELLQTMSARYDSERFGAMPQVDPRQADLLIVSGAISYKAAAELRKVYDQMLSPKYVMAIGSCANCGGLFGSETSYAVVQGADRLLPVDVYVPGCPPRPEAIMNGLLALQEKIREPKIT